MNKTIYLFFILLGGVISCKPPRYTAPLSPEQALQSFELNKDFRIELFAAEPFVTDPIAMSFDEAGHCYVVEMPDYPFPAEVGKERGQIKLLLDRDGDGRVDSAVVFADGLSEATSLLPWKGGLIVSAAPSILYLKDTTGDFKADVQEVLFTGFFKGNSEAQITALRFSVDNWVYAANSGQEGDVRSLKGDSAGLLMSGADFRFRLDRLQFEQESGSGQFGQTVDEWGNRFVTQNSDHIEQAIIPWRYWHRHPYLSSSDVIRSISDHAERMGQLTPAPYWRAERTRRRNKTYKEQGLDRVEYAEGHFTGAAGGLIYGGDAFPQPYKGSFFVADVAGNLVHRDVLGPCDSTPTWVARRAAQEGAKEFLASTDPWFRPTSFATGPDGCLYVVDMYRQHIETPFAIPEDLKKDMDFLKGSELGRIYRIVPKSGSPKRISPDLTQLSSADLVPYLRHSNEPFRSGAQKLLLERQDKSVAPLLKSFFKESNDPVARLHALYSLEGLGALPPELLNEAIKDGSPGIRAASIRLGEQYPQCLPAIEAACRDSSIQVAFQATLSLGNYPPDKVVSTLGQQLIRYGNDPWFRLAVLSAPAGTSRSFLKSLIQRGWFNAAGKEGQVPFLKAYARMVSLRNEEEGLKDFVALLTEGVLSQQKKYRLAGFTGLTTGLNESGTKPKLSQQTKRYLQTVERSSGDGEEQAAIKDFVRSIEKS